MIEVGSFYKALITRPRRCVTKKGLSKKALWTQVVGVPHKVVMVEGGRVVLNSFVSSSESQVFSVLEEELRSDFEKMELKEGRCYVEEYGIEINLLDEFETRKSVNKLKSDIYKASKDDRLGLLGEILKDKMPQVFVTQGSAHCITISKYSDYKEGKYKLGVMEHLGDTIFNRHLRWVPPVNMCYDEYAKTSSWPAPIGIRPKDFCLPSELLESAREMLIQLANFKGTDENSFKILKEYFPFLEKRRHICKYCLCEMDVEKYCSVYGSQENFAEICHRDPKGRFTKENMYWGHGECNRRQGGYSEEDRIEDALRLLENEEHMSKYLSKILGVLNKKI